MIRKDRTVWFRISSLSKTWVRGRVHRTAYCGRDRIYEVRVGDILHWVDHQDIRTLAQHAAAALMA